jgi:RHS repeat-associated protein
MVAINEISIADRDAGNRRVRKTVTNGGLAGNIPNGTTDSCWFGWQTMEERNPYGGTGGTDTPLKQYIWGSYIDECLQLNLLAVAGPQQLAVGVYYPLQDTLYRTMALVNSSGTPVEAYDTDPYGNTLIFTGPGPDGTWFTDDDLQSSYGANNIIYCGYRYDAETENYYVRNRYYSPSLGRWIQRDPIGYAGGINLYEYVAERAVVAVDPSGLLTEADGEAQANRCVDDCWNRRTDWPYRRDKWWYNKC